jgi:hypothetical protein
MTNKILLSFIYNENKPKTDYHKDGEENEKLN